MTNEQNAWSVIAKCMERKNCRQKDLAAALNMSSSAVSQIKKGAFLLDSNQLRTVIDFLNMSEEDVNEFYLMLFRARLRGNANSDDQLPEPKNPGLYYMKMLSLSSMAFFQPVLTPLSEFLDRMAEHRVCAAVPSSEHFAVLVPDDRLGVAADSVLILKSNCGVRDRNLVLAQRQNGLISLGYCTMRTGIFSLNDLTGEADCCQWLDMSKDFKWLFPVHQVVWPSSALEHLGR